MNLLTTNLRLVATRVAALLLLISPLALRAQYNWQSACGQGDYRIHGAGIHNLPSYSLFIPDGLDADSIVVEVIGKGAVVPTQCTFSSDSEMPQVETGQSLEHIGSGSHLTTVFRRTMAPASNITVATDDPANTWSVIAYVFKAESGGMSSVGSFAGYYIFRANWTSSYPLAPASGPRDVVVRIPITDLDPDGRFAYVAASAGGVEASQSIAISDMGERLSVVELVLSDVPADAQSVHVQVHSPNPATSGMHGDSFIFGVGISSRCDGDFSLACDSDQSLELIGSGIRGNSSTTLSIADSENIDRIVVEVVAKGHDLPSSITFSSDVEAPVAVSGTDLPPTGLGTEPVRVFRLSMEPASSITVESDAPNATHSVVGYVFRNESGAAAVGHFADTYLFRATSTRSYPLQPVDFSRNITVQVPLTEIEYDGRVAIITASAGGVSNSITIDTSDLGDYLTIAEVVLSDVPGSASSVTVSVRSPFPTPTSPGGDSFVFGVVIQAECSSICAPPAITGYDFVTPVSPIVTWEEVPGALRYEVCGRPVTSDLWRCHTRFVNDKRFFRMIPGVGHEIIVRVQCADGRISEYGPADTIYSLDARQGLALEEQPLERIQLFPNPAAHEVMIDLQGVEGKTLIEIRDLSGRVVAQRQAGEGQQQLRIDVSSQPVGMYLVQLTNGQHSETQRLMIAR
jgi:hypothetical protein